MQSSYVVLPPLDSIVEVLSRATGPFSVSDETTDYDELASRIDILSVALSGVDDYVAEEKTFRLGPRSLGQVQREGHVALHGLRDRRAMLNLGRYA